MLFDDTNSHLMTKPSDFDIKCHSNFESYDRASFFGTHFKGSQLLLLLLFQRDRVLWGWLAGPSLIESLHIYGEGKVIWTKMWKIPEYQKRFLKCSLYMLTCLHDSEAIQKLLFSFLCINIFRIFDGNGVGEDQLKIIVKY